MNEYQIIKITILTNESFNYKQFMDNFNKFIRKDENIIESDSICRNPNAEELSIIHML